MKFSATLVSIALALAGSAYGHAHVKNLHRRGGPSATFVPTTSAAAPTSAAPPASTSASGSGVVKRGISYSDIKATEQFGSKISWLYDWGSNPGGTVPAGKEYVPMLWSDDSSHTNTWNDDATAAIANGATHLLGFNEPDLSSQANMSPQQAAAAWRQWMEPFAGKAKLCSPAITNGGAPMGTAWLDEFMQECSDCHIDCIAFHIYDSATNIAYFQSYITEIGTRYKLPSWMTEFGASGSTQDQQTFLETMLPFLDGLSTNERYAYFMAGGNILVDDSDSILPLGQTYNSI